MKNTNRFFKAMEEVGITTGTKFKLSGFGNAVFEFTGENTVSNSSNGKIQGILFYQTLCRALLMNPEDITIIPEKFIPREGQEFWFYEAELEDAISYCFRVISFEHLSNVLIGNCFKTKQEAINSRNIAKDNIKSLQEQYYKLSNKNE